MRGKRILTGPRSAFLKGVLPLGTGVAVPDIGDSDLSLPTKNQSISKLASMRERRERNLLSPLTPFNNLLLIPDNLLTNLPPSLFIPPIPFPSSSLSPSPPLPSSSPAGVSTSISSVPAPPPPKFGVLAFETAVEAA